MKKLLTGPCACAAVATILLAPYHAAAAPPDIPIPLKVYDARGKAAGRYFPVSSFGMTVPGQDSTALLDIGGALVVLYLVPATLGAGYHATSLRWQVGTGTVFASTDCSGAPLVQASIPGTRPVAFRRDSSGSLIAYIGAKGLSSPQRFQSALGYDGECIPLPGDQAIDAWPLEKTVDITQLHPEPLTVR